MQAEIMVFGQLPLEFGVPECLWHWTSSH